MIFLDCETTGFDSKKNELLEIAIVWVEDRKIIGSRLWCFNSIGPIPSKITELNGTTKEGIKFYPLLNSELREEIECHLNGFQLLAHNEKFDRGFLDANGIKTYEIQWACTMKLFKKRYPRLKSYSLPNLLAQFLAPEEIMPGAHTSIVDAINLARLCLKMEIV